MRSLLFIILCIITLLPVTQAQHNSWLKGGGYGLPFCSSTISENASTQLAVASDFTTGKAPAFFAAYATVAVDTARKPATRKDSLKYFPTLLGDSMSIHFDPNKYLPRNSGTTTKDTLPVVIAMRTTSLVNTYRVSSPNIVVQLYDNGQIDGDVVSVYYNNKLIVDHQALTHKAITFTINATASGRHHEFTLISDNEGTVPPNTALMRIRAGSQQFELNVSSSSTHNARIAIDYTGE